MKNKALFHGNFRTHKKNVFWDYLLLFGSLPLDYVEESQYDPMFSFEEVTTHFQVKDFRSFETGGEIC
jgi:hypothetical protein